MTGVDEAQASGVTGEGITVAVIDGPINPQMSELVGADLVVRQDGFCDYDGDGALDPAVATDAGAEHASNMAAYIIGTGKSSTGVPGVRGVAPGATVRYYAVLSGSREGDKTCEVDGRDATAAALEQALDDGADIVSMSFASDSWGAEADEVVARAVREGVILVGASYHGDMGQLLGYPAAYNGAIGVEVATVTGERAPEDVVSPQLGVVAPGQDFLFDGFDEASGAWNVYRPASGSSMATAWTAGVLALAWSAHPEATGNQMIQALVRTTSQNAGQLRRIDDAWGYGFVNAWNLMSVDPAQYPDVNPLIREGVGELPNADQIANAPTPSATASATPSATPTASPSPTGDRDGGDSGVLPGLISGGVGVLVLVAIGVVVVVKRRR